jgi:2-phospho-L-lactate guanylyltransferase
VPWPMVAFVSFPPGPAPWTVLLPLKNLARAKSRLHHPDRGRLALAMAVDTVTAVLTTSEELVAGVSVITSDPAVESALASAPELPATARHRLVVLPDTPGAGLNPALAHGAAVAGERWPGRPLAALSADLPALRPAELRRALLAASSHARAVLADAAGTGTVLLTAAAGTALAPAFGPRSNEAHRRSGAVDITAALGSDVPGLRRDVDTLEDLDEARSLGVGSATAAALTGGLQIAAAEGPAVRGHRPATPSRRPADPSPGAAPSASVPSVHRWTSVDGSGPGRAKWYP